MTLLKDKVAVITGGGRGIGKATALAFAKEGARVVINDLGAELDGTGSDARVAEEVAEAIAQSGGEAVASSHSVADPSAAERLIEFAVDRFGGVDVLVNCAGIAREGTLLKVSEADFTELLRVHLGGCLWCSQSAAQWMRKHGGGSIVMMTSAAGLMGNFGQSAAAAADAGVYGLMRTASIELQRHGVRVNAVAALAKTRLTEQLPLFEQVESMTPEHVAPVNVFLGSDVSQDVTGCVISVAGGRLSVFRMSESSGSFKENDGGVWGAAEIAEHFAAIRR